ncbi:MAG: XRE family transcriptional regulator, partial [Bacillota bacterium]
LIFLRRKHNLTQQELAEKINYSDNAISRWERGEATPSVETLALIADYFAVNVADLLDENFPAKNAPKEKGKRVQRIFVILFSVSIVWTFALIGFIYTQMFKISLGNYGENGWLLFVMSVPISCLVLYFYNKLWGNKVYHLIIFSVFWWSIIATIYLHILVLTGVNLWLIFLLGIPFELAQVLWFFIRR